MDYRRKRNKEPLRLIGSKAEKAVFVNAEREEFVLGWDEVDRIPDEDLKILRRVKR